MAALLFWSAAASLCACTLTFDTAEVPFGDPEPTPSPEPEPNPDPNPEPNPTPNPTPNPDPNPDPEPMPLADLGRICGLDTGSLCLPEDDEAWPACASEACQRRLGEEAQCHLLPALDNFGFCTVPCTSDADCFGEPSDPFASTMRCVTDQTGAGLCLPGSQSSCRSDSTCPDGEVCRLTLTVTENGVDQGLVCQTALLRGADRGEFCIDDPRRSNEGRIALCANNLCSDDVCAGLCDTETDDNNYCGSPNMGCSPIGENSPNQGVCAPRSCESPSDCVAEQGKDVFCATNAANPRTGPGPRKGFCRADNPDSAGSRELGDTCVGLDGGSDSARCASRMCQGQTPFFYCSAYCDTDADCGNDLVCALDRFTDEFGVYYLNTCTYAPGSQSRCDNGAACPDGEVCAPFIKGQVSDDGTQAVGAEAQGLCIEPVPGGVAQGTACQEQSCLAPGACVSVGGGASLCTTVCEPFVGPCDIGDVCASVTVLDAEEHADGPALQLGFCVPFF